MGRIVGLVLPEAPAPEKDLVALDTVEDIENEAPAPEKKAGGKKKGEDN